MINLFKKLFRKANITVIIYLILNIALIIAVLYFMFLPRLWIAIPLGIILYAISLSIAVSPVGEWILRFETDCQEINDPKQKALLQPIFSEVYTKAKTLDPKVPDNVKLYICKSSEPNAFATGRKTICVTDGLLQRPKSEIKAAIGHEFGHLAHKDTCISLMVVVGNMFINIFIGVARLMIELLHIVTSIFMFFLGKTLRSLAEIFRSLYRMLITTVINGLIQLWTMLGVFLIRKTDRNCEYEADKFSFDLGYKDGLISLFEYLSTKEKGHKKMTLIMALSRSHPKTTDRIARIKALSKVSCLEE